MSPFATNGDEPSYRGLGTGILRALAATSRQLELESNYDRNLFIARIPRRDS